MRCDRRSKGAEMLALSRAQLIVSVILAVAISIWHTTPGYMITLSAEMPAATSPWSVGHHSKVRMIASDIPREPWLGVRMVGVQVQFDKGWKSYWRSPGDAGGIPPTFDWSGSENVGRIEVLYPAPKRYQDAYGPSIGYKREIVFPVLVTPKHPSNPIELKLNFAYGVCKDICIPAEAEMNILLSEVARGTIAGPVIDRYLQQVPMTGRKTPKVVFVEAVLEGANPELVIEAEFARGVAGADLFVEASNGLFVPLPDKMGTGDDGRLRFRVDLNKAEDPALFRGQTLKLTLVSDGGHSETAWQLK